MGLDNIVETGVVWEKIKTGVKWAAIGFVAGYISSCTMGGCDADASMKYERPAYSIAADQSMSKYLE